ncbi:hypothetical protein KKG72_10350 [bacterium]|nr:hypothetical protein [bacterium]MBU1994451.1 hypothetical protein [bacterium]
MVKLSRFLGYFVFFILALMYFTPKVSVYYFLEQQLKPYAVIISSEEVKDDGFTLGIEHASISVKSIESANIGEIGVKIFVLYNSLNLKNITLSSAAGSFIPLQADAAEIRYTVLNPLHVVAHAKGDFGEVQAQFNLLQNTLHLKLIPSDVMLKDYTHTLKTLVKNESGEYLYDKTF